MHGVSTFKTSTKVIENESHFLGILQYLKTEAPDVVVIGARGQSKIETMILGRISEKVIAQAPSSVFVVKNLD